MGKIAFVFAGQGTQFVGMGRELYENNTAARAVLDRAEALRPGLLALCFDGDSQALNQTVHTQPSLFAVDVACAEAFRSYGIVPHGVAGFSLGEVPAICYAGMLDFDAAFDFVCRRAQAMQACAEAYPGAMLAVLKLSAEAVEAICRAVGDAFPVNYNCPSQIVVACGVEAADAVAQAVAAQSGRTVRLAVSGAFHSPFMDAAAASMAAWLAGHRVQQPTLPIYANVTAQPYGDKQLLARQINHPVLWQTTIETMLDAGFTHFIEVGPGKTLSGLIQKISGDARVYHGCDTQSLQAIAAEVIQYV